MKPARQALLIGGGLALAVLASFLGYQAARGGLCIPVSTNNALGIGNTPITCLYAPP
ncbi:MAG: hypothetical protein U0228_24470 [Myxococcaceae bacterium]